MLPVILDVNLINSLSRLHVMYVVLNICMYVYFMYFFYTCTLIYVDGQAPIMQAGTGELLQYAPGGHWNIYRYIEPFIITHL